MDNELAQAPPLAEVSGKVAYVTGGSSGIGLGIARVLYDAGMKVAIGYICEEQIGEALKFFKPDDPNVLALRHDVVDREGWVASAEAIERRFGRVHLLVNNAGVGIQAPASSGTYKDWEWGLGVNLWGVINGVHTFVPRMLAHNEGSHIVTISSLSGVLPGNGAGIYTVAKIAAVGLMEELRLELRKTTIGTSVFCPGGVATNIARSEDYRPAALRNIPAPPPIARVGAPAPPTMDAMEAARHVLAGIRNNDLFIFSHPEFRPGIKLRCDAMLESMEEKPLPTDGNVATLLRTPIYAQEIAHRRATRQRRN